MEENITVCGGVEVKLKKCKNINCGIMFTPERPMQTTCCPFPCAIEYSKQLQAKKQDSEKRKAKKEFNENDRTVLLKLAQTVFNKYIRLRDGNNCISCDYKGEGRQIHCGHYMSQGGNSALRFSELNCHSQCVQCNNYKSGNLNNYRIRLIEKIGIDEVIRLETTKNTKLWTVDELKEIIETYKRKIKELSL